jgi:hypothetical protein
MQPFFCIRIRVSCSKNLVLDVLQEALHISIVPIYVYASGDCNLNKPNGARNLSNFQASSFLYKDLEKYFDVLEFHFRLFYSLLRSK